MIEPQLTNMTTVIPKFIELGFRYRWAPAAIAGAVNAGYHYLTAGNDVVIKDDAEAYSSSFINSTSSSSSAFSSSSSSSYQSTSYSSIGELKTMPTRYGKSRSYKPRRASRSGKSRGTSRPVVSLTEKKYHDLPAWTMVPGTDVSTTSVHHINGMYVGNLGNQLYDRSSAAPYMKSLTLIGELESSVSTLPGRLDLMVVRDLAPLSALPSVSEIFSSPFGMPNANCMMNTDAITRFKVLRRFTFNYNDTAVSAANQPFNISIPLNFSQRFKPGSTTSVIGDITENALYIVALSTNTFASTPSLRITGRFFYFDR